MKHPLRLISILFLVTLLLACDGDTFPFNLPPTLTVSEATDIYRKGATISGTYTKANDKVGIETFGLYYATNSMLGDADSILATTEELQAGSYTITLNNLTPATTYYYATFASSGFSIVKSDIKQFRTSDTTEPKLGEVATSNITRTSFDVSSSILDDGGSDITIRGFLVREAPSDISSLGFEDRQVRVENNVDFNTTISDLTPGSRYAVCAYAMSAKAYGFSEIKYVSTANQNEPVVSSTTASTTSVAHELLVTASVVDEGTSPVTERGFVYSTDMLEPTLDNTKVVAQGNNESFTATLKDLSSTQKYYIRAYAKSNDGIGYGDVLAYNEADYVQQPSLSVVLARLTTTAHEIQVTASAAERTYAITEHGFVYSTDTQNPTVENKNTSVNATGNNSSFTATISNLSSTVTTYIRAYVKTSYGYSYGETLSFKESDYVQQPSVSTVTAKPTTNAHEIQVTASVTERTYAITERGFVYSTDTQTPTVENKNTSVKATGNNSSFTATISSLSSSATTYIRAYVKTSFGYTYGETFHFKEMDYVQQPSVSVVIARLTTTAHEIQVTASAAERTYAITERGFVYSTDTQTPTVENKNTSVKATGNNSSFTATISNLSSSTITYIRAYVKTSYGYTYGETLAYMEMDYVQQPTVSSISAYTTEMENILFVTASVTQQGTYTVTERGFVYSTDTQAPSAESNRKVLATGTNQSFTASLTDLDQNQTNYIRAYVRTSAGDVYGETFTYNSKDFPALITKSATNILESSVQLNASINSKNSQISQYGFVWSNTNSVPTIRDKTTFSTILVGENLASNLSGLTGNTTYYYRAYAKHAKGVSYGAVMQFTTLLVQQASLSGVTISNISFKTATFNANVTALNNGTLTDAGFVYSTSPNPTTSDKRLSLGVTTSLSTICSSLAANTTYFIRAYATNEKGTAYGAQATFTTKKEGSIDHDGYDDSVIDLDK
ncbi:MAG: hypothetical protein K6F94_05395 [Bacteroidaceae bacterium]|nr:hypothetical protein [Bacteroidaceae bacterium]